MTDQENQMSPTRAVSPMKVWVCTYEHRDGLDTWACAGEDLAYRELSKVCRDFWEEAREVDDSMPRDGEESLPSDPPAEDRTAVERFFIAMNFADPPESFLIAAHKVVGVEGGVDR